MKTPLTLDNITSDDSLNLEITHIRESSNDKNIRSFKSVSFDKTLKSNVIPSDNDGIISKNVNLGASASNSVQLGVISVNTSNIFDISKSTTPNSGKYLPPLLTNETVLCSDNLSINNDYINDSIFGAVSSQKLTESVNTAKNVPNTISIETKFPTSFGGVLSKTEINQSYNEFIGGEDSIVSNNGDLPLNDATQDFSDLSSDEGISAGYESVSSNALVFEINSQNNASDVCDNQPIVARENCIDNESALTLTKNSVPERIPLPGPGISEIRDNIFILGDDNGHSSFETLTDHVLDINSALIQTSASCGDSVADYTLTDSASDNKLSSSETVKVNINSNRKSEEPFNTESLLSASPLVIEESVIPNLTKAEINLLQQSIVCNSSSLQCHPVENNSPFHTYISDISIKQKIYSTDTQHIATTPQSLADISSLTSDIVAVVSAVSSSISQTVNITDSKSDIFTDGNTLQISNFTTDQCGSATITPSKNSNVSEEICPTNILLNTVACIDPLNNTSETNSAINIGSETPTLPIANSSSSQTAKTLTAHKTLEFKCRTARKSIIRRSNSLEVEDTVDSVKPTQFVSKRKLNSDSEDKSKARTARKSYRPNFPAAMKSCARENEVENSVSSESYRQKAKKSCSTRQISLDLCMKSSDSLSSTKDIVKLVKNCICEADGVLLQFASITEKLPDICEAKDSIDDKIVPCSKPVANQSCFSPSTDIKSHALCHIHQARIKKHHCCPKCGVFCTQGSFLRCMFKHRMKGKVAHLFHLRCFSILQVGLPPSCPHCSRFEFQDVELKCVDGADSQSISGPSKYQDLIILENYKILISSVIPEQETLDDCDFSQVPSGQCLLNPIKSGDLTEVLMLLGKGVDPNHKFTELKNNTPLHAAAVYGNLAILHSLIQFGSFMDAVNNDLETALFLAVQKNHVFLVQHFINAGAIVDAMNINGATPFHLAVKCGSIEMIDLLYATSKVNINAQDRHGCTPLIWALEMKKIDMVEWLLHNGSDPNIRDNEGNTALHWAVYFNLEDAIGVLIAKGCHRDYANYLGDTPLHVAAREDYFYCLKPLISGGAFLDNKNKCGETPIMCCKPYAKSYRILKNYSAFISLRVKEPDFHRNILSRDISGGIERFPIEVINEIDSNKFKMDFQYLQKSFYSRGIQVIKSVDRAESCQCKDGCRTSKCTCNMLSQCLYNPNSTLSPDFDYHNPQCIFECCNLCHCNKNCINRVVQNGVRVPMQVFRTQDHGWGVRALTDISKGSFICEYVGEIVSGDAASSRRDDSYLFDLESPDRDFCIDGKFFGNVSRYFNHSCNPNIISLRTFLEHRDLNFPRIAFFSKRDIKAHEELCFDYGFHFWVIKSKTFLCSCRFSSCKYSKETIDMTLKQYFEEENNN